MKNRETLRVIIESIIDKQLEKSQPPETSQTYYRLIEKESFTEEEARMLISRVIQIELFRLMRFAEPFNKVRFLRNLSKLPDLPSVD